MIVKMIAKMIAKMKTKRLYTLLVLLMVFVVSCTKPDEPNNGGNIGENDVDLECSGNIGGHDYVDLGLPSGTLWAVYNIGADSIGGYGDAFAWGETVPKVNYAWANYKYCNGDYNQLTKYCCDSLYGYHGFADTLKYLQDEDDAAVINWGEGWRMPSPDEFEELMNCCQYLRTSLNGVNGLLFTAPNGKSLFLPSAGVYSMGEHQQAETYGFYWANKLGADNIGVTMGCVFNFYYFDIMGTEYVSAGDEMTRAVGLPIRPVHIAD